jgi:1-aminocyclopropane-1-carboxylate deaminase/D-cysteine desulfhydrase-like pyridoxal-dependent ACC family enzyme
MQDPFYQLQWQLLKNPRLQQLATEIWVCQLQTKVPTIAGNKWLKLKYHIQQIQQHNKTGIVSFGGAFSNHLLALAAAGQAFGFATVGIVRSHLHEPNSPTLQQCRALGMQLHFVAPIDYRQACAHAERAAAAMGASNATEPHPWQQQYPDYWLLPEGGTATLALPGVAELPLWQTPAGAADLLACASASGGTLAGLIAGQLARQQANLSCADLLGIAVVKDSSLANKVEALLPSAQQYPDWQLWPEQSGKAYGKFSPETLQFCLQLATEQLLFTEPVYTGKALHSLVEWAQQGRIAPGRRIAFLHTGGLQGVAGLAMRGLITPQQQQCLTPS